MPANTNSGSQPTSKTGKSTPSKPMRPRRDGPLPIADMYLLRSVVEDSLRGLGWFAGLFLAFAIVTSARRVAQDDLPIKIVLELISLQAPRIILFTIPASLLFGTVSTFTEMSSKGEITALMAGGMSLRRMLRGPLAFAAVMGIFAFILQEVIVPNSESQKDSIVKGAAAMVGEQKNFKIEETFPNGNLKQIVQADSFDPGTKVLIKPVVHIFRDDNTVETEITAKRAHWDESKKLWTLENVDMRYTPRTTGNGANTTYDNKNHFETWDLKTDMELTPGNLSGSNITTQDRLKNHNYEMVSLSDLAKYRAGLLANYKVQKGELRHRTAKEMRTITFGIHDKLATPLVCLAMILIGAPLGIRPQRSASAGLAMGLSLAVLIFYYIVWTLATSWGKGGGQSPEIVAYFSSVMTAGIGAVMVARKS